MNLKEKIKNLPSSPGVYFMKDSSNSIIYVGKSKNLKSRVGSYFINSKSHSPKVVKLVKNIKDFDYTLTDTEFEAFMLECKLIKQIKPFYNKKMKNPLSYAYIRIKNDYSKMEVSTEREDENEDLYFGPYTSKNMAERVVQGIKEYYKIDCNGNFRKASPCLNYSLGSCIGMCFDSSAKIKYNTIIGDIIKLLSGTNKSILNKMELNMKEASESLDFDTAAKYRDLIAEINYLINREKVVEFTEENKSIALLEYLDEHTVKLFVIRGIKILFSRKYNLSDFNTEILNIALQNEIIAYLKDKDLNDLVEIGKYEIDESQIIYSYLKFNQNSCKYIRISKEWIDDENIAEIAKALISLVEK